jgi:amphi-Trp domain-containing protein
MFVKRVSKPERHFCICINVPQKRVWRNFTQEVEMSKHGDKEPIRCTCAEKRAAKQRSEDKDDHKKAEHHHSENVKLSHTANLEYQTALNVLQQVLDIARDGRFMIENEGKAVVVFPAQEVDLKIKARQKNGRESIAFELAWPSVPENERAGVPTGEAEFEGDVCVAELLRRNRAAAEREDAELERRFEQALFGGCGCVEVPGSEGAHKHA